MTRISLVLLALLLQSCAGLRVVTNGTRVPSAALPEVTDPMVVVDRFDSIGIGPRAVLVGTTKIKAPTQAVSYYYRAMIGVCKREAQRLHGNVIEVLDYSDVMRNFSGCSEMTAKIYSMPEPWLTDLNQQIQSAKEQETKSLQGRSVVHLKFRGRSRGLIPITFHIYLNNTKVFKFTDGGAPLAPSDMTTLTFTEPGYLSIGPEISVPDYLKVNIVMGKEYFIYVKIDRYRQPCMTEMNKDFFLNDL